MFPCLLRIARIARSSLQNLTSTPARSQLQLQRQRPVVLRPFIRKMPESKSQAHLVWIDCEMTGLDYDNDSILSLACFVTDYDLNMLDDTGFEAIIHHPKERLDQMDEWCTSHHAASGLTAACIASTTSAEDAGAGLLAYVKKHVPTKRSAMLAGNSVHVDAAFLRRPQYDRVLGHLHYRQLDVSAIKEAAKRWMPEDVLRNSPQKKAAHEARQDILESIAEARYYRDVIFRRPDRGAEESGL